LVTTTWTAGVAGWLINLLLERRAIMPNQMGGSFFRHLHFDRGINPAPKQV